ncbi:MAG: nitrile hydratase subunit beta [Betaproteobacteria bacterium]
MNGGQDLGGAHGFGPVLAESDEPVFHQPWEKRAFAVTLALGMLGRWNIDMSRSYRENRNPVDYLSSTYYELWLKGVERLAVDRGLISEQELAGGHALSGRDPALKPPDAARARDLLVGSRGAKLNEPVAAVFAPHDKVRVKNLNPSTHTRMPRYCRGKTGTIVTDHGVYIFPDTHALDLGPKPQHCYSVRFTALELWGETRRDTVHIDLWDDYLEKA